MALNDHFLFVIASLDGQELLKNEKLQSSSMLRLNYLIFVSSMTSLLSMEHSFLFYFIFLFCQLSIVSKLFEHFFMLYIFRSLITILFTMLFITSP
jgi:hypothetical protein